MKTTLGVLLTCLILFSAILVSSLLLLGAVPASAQVPQDQELNYQGTKYACTGVAESKEDPRWAKYPVKLMFTAGGRAYISFVQVTIQDAGGKTVLETDCDAPWVVVDLKPGAYSVQAVAERKHRKTAKLQVSGGQAVELAIRFPEISMR